MSAAATPAGLACWLLGIAIGIVGCASEPADLGRIRASFDRLASDPQVQQRAGVELREAEIAVDEAESAWREQGNYDEAVHLSYLAERRVELASLAAQRRAYQDQINSLPRQAAARRLAKRDRQAPSMRQGDTRIQLAGDEGGLDALLARLEAEPDERGVVTLGDVLFDFDRSELKPGAEASLDRLAGFLLRMTGRSVLVEGHTDDTGVLEYNFDLSRRRAEAVKRKLLEDGVAPERVVAVGYGPVYPVESNGTPTGRSRNRRVEIVVLGRGEQLDDP